MERKVFFITYLFFVPIVLLIPFTDFDNQKRFTPIEDPAIIQSDKDSIWRLIWQDDFLKEGMPDANKWNLIGAGSPAWMCYCSKDPKSTQVENGILNLLGFISDNKVDTPSYKTGCIETRDRFNFKYGKVEVRVKFPQKKGTWPAVWLMPKNSTYGNWPKSGEIDIMEHVGIETKIHQTVHSGYIEIDEKTDDPPNHTTVLYNIGEFNVYSLEWSPDKLDFFVNGEKTFSYPKIQNGPKNQWPFDQPFYIIMDLALGGCDWLEAPNSQELPAKMQIDWIRVYQSL